MSFGPDKTGAVIASAQTQPFQFFSQSQSQPLQSPQPSSSQQVIFRTQSQQTPLENNDFGNMINRNNAPRLLRRSTQLSTKSTRSIK